MFPQQSDAALAALTIFETLRYVLFRADVQSGKTGAYHGIIRTMMERGLIDRAYILCGSHETELRSQCHEDVKEHHTAEHQKKIRVIFRQDFKKNTMTTRRALIVVDETHLVAEKDQTLSRFLGKHGLSMAGTTKHMVDNETYILSVSATPHAEESAMIHGDSGEKGRVVMSPGKGYYGPKNYYEDGHVREVYPLHDIRGKHNFPLLLDRLAEQGPSYLLFRVSKNKQMKHLQARLADWQKDNTLQIVEFNSDKKDKDREIVLTRKEQQEHETKWRIRIPCLEEQPAVMTVVFLKGRLRCGKRVPKQHVSLAWEMSKHANTDTIIQSLLGRLSGYDVPERKPLIFLPPALLQKQEKSVVPLSDLERYLYSNQDDQKEIDIVQLIPRYASHIIPGNAIRKTNRSPCPPIRFTIPVELLTAPDAEIDKTIKQHCLTIMNEHSEWIQRHAVLTTEQKQEILSSLSQISNKEVHIRHYRGTSNQGMYTAHTIAYETQTASSEHIDGFPFVTFCVVHGDFQPNGSARFRPTEGEVYAILYTESPGLFRAIHRGSRIPLHSGATHFSIQDLSHEDEPILASCVAGSGYGFSSAIFHDPEALFEQFDHFIRIAKTGIGLFGRTFTSLREGEAIRLSRAAYGNRLERLKEVCDRLERTHSVHIRFQEKRYRPTVVSAAAPAPVDHGLLHITWSEDA